MHIGGNLHTSHSCANMQKPEHWQQCIIHQMVMSKADGGAGNDCPWLLECNTPMSTFYFLVHLSMCYKKVMNMTSSHGGNLMGMQQQGTQVWKWANPDKILHSVPCDTDDTRMVFCFMSTATEISWSETVRDAIYKEFCLSSYRYSPPDAVIYQPTKVIWQAWSPA